MVRIRRFGVVRTATVAAVMYAVVVLFFTVVAAIFALFAAPAAENVGGVQMPVGAGAVGVLVAGAIVAGLYAVFGWIATAIACAVYNFVAGMTGGIEVEIEPPTAGGVVPGSNVRPM